ncbi:MAG: UDP-N-acetylmuramoyl-L-alanine--D-glutamate ligase [Gammaproteobacteria bacterium]|nr:UDP-N-acetylmuramoyl-L-alanine--D-glutamate ligase [Gammaproteobacteria bacterium]
MKRLVLIVGLGKTGLSVARYLQYKGIAFSMFDTRKEPLGLDAFRVEFPDVSVFLGDYPDDEWDEITRIVCSPGVSLDIALIAAARKRNILVESDIDCFAREISAPVVAITGTNGKSTVTTLLGEMASAAGRSVGVAGNIGTPVLERLQDIDLAQSIDLWVLELSSFQLEITHALQPIAATFLNLSDDHLDRHHDEASYCAAKQRVYRGGGTLLFNRDDAATYPDERYLKAGVNLQSYGRGVPKVDEWGFVLDENEVYWLAHGEQLILSIEQLGIQGIHNALNALAALALAEVIGLPIETSVQVLKAFKGLPHRCQVIRKLDDVTWIDDSKGTNVGSTESAIQGFGPLFKGKLILIAGGQGKGADFRVLRASLQAHVRVLVLIGEDAALLAEALGDLAEVIYAQSMEEAVHFAKAHAQSGDAVILSPACASFDLFRDFNHRGEVFTNLVEAL